MDKIEIRLARPADANSIARLHSHWQGGEFDSFLKKTTAELAGEGVFSKLVTIVAHSGKEFLGFAKIFHFQVEDFEECFTAPVGHYLTGVCVEKKYRAKTVGSRLTKFRIEYLKPITNRIYYFTDSDNLPSIQLHAKIGFQFLTHDFTFPGARALTGQKLSLFKLDC